MPTLYLLRHAKSSWDDPSLADHDRPLAPRGRRAARRMREHLQAERIRPALVLCSSSVRTRETLERIAPSLGAKTAIKVERDLYGASAERLLARLHEVPDGTASTMVIGHNPGLHDLALSLAGSGPALRHVYEKFPTGALATLELASAWSALEPGQAELVAFVSPRDL